MSVQSYLSHRMPSQLSIHHVAIFKPFTWLARAWQDLTAHPKASLAHGLAVTALILITLLVTSLNVYIIAAAISGFLLIGPILAAGLCEMSRLDERGEPVSFDDSLTGLSRSQNALMEFAIILLGFSLLWFFVSGLVLLVTVGSIAPPLNQILWGDFFQLVTSTQLILYSVIGGLLAIMVFILSVVTVPMIVEKNVHPLYAMGISIRVTGENLFTMLVWASLIVLLTVIGFATFLLGMIVIYPLLGHATWHAYRDLIDSVK